MVREKELPNQIEYKDIKSIGVEISEQELETMINQRSEVRTTMKRGIPAVTVTKM